MNATRIAKALALFFFVTTATLQAQWVTETYPLKAGWNAIWISHDCSVMPDGSTRAIDTALAGDTRILEVWRWNPLGSTVQFIDSPDRPIQSKDAWAVWRRNDPTNSTLGTLTGNAAYLVNVQSTAAAFTLSLTGKPLAPSYSFSSSGLNFIGFPVQTPDSSATRNFETFFSFSEVLKSNPSVFFYNGGALSDANPRNPLQISTPRFTAVSRGKAYWVKGNAYSDYYGPVKVTVIGSSGIEFGDKLNVITVRVKNVTDAIKNQTVTATFTLSPSAVFPNTTPKPAVPMRVRGPRDASLQFTYSTLPAALTLGPGEEKDLVLALDRTAMTVAGQSYESILSVTDSLAHTRIDLPVSATANSKAGVWIGAAVLNSVDRVETITGPETDAPLVQNASGQWVPAADNPGGVAQEPVTNTTSTATAAGITTSTRVLMWPSTPPGMSIWIPRASRLPMSPSRGPLERRRTRRARITQSSPPCAPSSPMAAAATPPLRR